MPKFVPVSERSRRTFNTCRARPEIHQAILDGDHKHPSGVDFFCDVVAGAARQDSLGISRPVRYAMLIINADSHPLMSRMHKPDPKLPPDQQNKRSVIPIELQDVDQWLAETINEDQELLKLALAEVFSAGPA